MQLVLREWWSKGVSENVFVVQHVHVTFLSWPCDNEWGWDPYIMEPGLGSHTGPHHSRQFCLMCMQGRYQGRDTGSHLLHLFCKVFLLFLRRYNLSPQTTSQWTVSSQRPNSSQRNNILIASANYRGLFREAINIQFHNKLGQSRSLLYFSPLW